MRVDLDALNQQGETGNLCRSPGVHGRGIPGHFARIHTLSLQLHGPLKKRDQMGMGRWEVLCLRGNEETWNGRQVRVWCDLQD